MEIILKILIISDSFLPEATSSAVHMSELQKYYDMHEFETTVCTSAFGKLDIGTKHLKRILQAPNYWKRSNNFILRALGEFLSGIILGLKLRFLIDNKKIDKVIIYSPTIFWALTLRIANLDISKIRLIVRDMFPIWLLKAGILHRSNFSFVFLNYIAKLQFDLVGKIYVQSEADAFLIRKEYSISEDKLFHLKSWYDEMEFELNERIDRFIDPKKKNMLWLGNMGVAQNRDFVLSVLLKAIQQDSSIKINLVGLKGHDRSIAESAISNLSEGEKERITLVKYLSHGDCTQLAMRSTLGVFALGEWTTEGNMPGKFITYIMAGLPVFGMFAEKNEMTRVIVQNNLGSCCHRNCVDTAVIAMIHAAKRTYDRSHFQKYFRFNHSTEAAAKLLID